MAVSVRDVAAVAAVSVGTVSNVLNRPDKVAPATAERVLAAIDSLGFVRNDAARQLRAGRSRSIGLVVLDIRNPFFTDIARGAEERAAEKGMTLLVGSSQEDPDRERAYLDLFLEQRVQRRPAVARSPTAGTGWNGCAATEFRSCSSTGSPRTTHFSSVAVDDVVGGRLAVRHLIEVGRRRIAYVGGPPSIRQVADRLRGARQAVRRALRCRARGGQTDALTVLAGRAAGELIRERKSRRPARRDLRGERPARHRDPPGAACSPAACGSPRTSR